MKSEPIRLLIIEGVISRAEVQPVANRSGWQLVFFRKTTGHEPIIYEKDSGGDRLFKTLESCMNFARLLGMKKIEVIL
jgi:hypothetical protein